MKGSEQDIRERLEAVNNDVPVVKIVMIVPPDLVRELDKQCLKKFY
jgi:hypothetical protein